MGPDEGREVRESYERYLATFICRDRLMMLTLEFYHITGIFSANTLVKMKNLTFYSFWRIIVQYHGNLVLVNFCCYNQGKTMLSSVDK